MINCINIKGASGNVAFTTADRPHAGVSVKLIVPKMVSLVNATAGSLRLPRSLLSDSTTRKRSTILQNK